jgi:uncharacterized protein (TIGR02996 family)
MKPLLEDIRDNRFNTSYYTLYADWLDDNGQYENAIFLRECVDKKIDFMLYKGMFHIEVPKWIRILQVFWGMPYVVDIPGIEIQDHLEEIKDYFLRHPTAEPHFTELGIVTSWNRDKGYHYPYQLPEDANYPVDYYDTIDEFKQAFNKFLLKYIYG